MHTPETLARWLEYLKPQNEEDEGPAVCKTCGESVDEHDAYLMDRGWRFHLKEECLKKCRALKEVPVGTYTWPPQLPPSWSCDNGGMINRR